MALTLGSRPEALIVVSQSARAGGDVRDAGAIRSLRTNLEMGWRSLAVPIEDEQSAVSRVAGFLLR